MGEGVTYILYSKHAQIFNEPCRSPKKNGNNTNLQFDRKCTDKNNERESGKLPGATYPSTLMWPQRLRKPSLH